MNEVIFDSDSDGDSPPIVSTLTDKNGSSDGGTNRTAATDNAHHQVSAAAVNSSSSSSSSIEEAQQHAGPYAPPPQAAAATTAVHNAKETVVTFLLPNELVPMEVEEQGPAADAGLVAGSGFSPKFKFNDLVDVKHRPRKGKDKEGGRARVLGVHPVSIDDPSLGFQYDVTFVVFRKREYRIDEYDILPVDEQKEADRSRHTLGRCKYVMSPLSESHFYLSQ